jgi:hypothetical protein
VHFPGAPRPLQENKINKNGMKLKNKKKIRIKIRKLEITFLTEIYQVEFRAFSSRLLCMAKF